MNQSDMQRMALDSLVAMSNRYGRDPRYVLIGGGNSSWKTSGEIYIKASGSSLATIAADGFAGLARARLDAIMDKSYDRGDDAKREADVLADIMAARLPGSGHLRPSVETPLHNLFPHAYVLHLHPALVNGMTCGLRGREAALEIFGDDAVWIPEIKPGFELSQYCRRIIAEYGAEHGAPPKIMFLQNHGVFVAADSVDEIDALYAGIMSILSDIAAEIPVSEAGETSCGPASEHAADVRLIRGAILAMPPANAPEFVLFYVDPDVLHLLENRGAFEPLSGAFTPDHIVYCKARFLFIDEPDVETCARVLPRRYAEFEKKFNYAPRVICFRGVGAFCCANTESEADNALALFKDAVKIAVYSRSFGGPRHLSAELVDFIENWEIESYRQKIARGQ